MGVLRSFLILLHVLLYILSTFNMIWSRKAQKICVGILIIAKIAVHTHATEWLIVFSPWLVWTWVGRIISRMFSSFEKIYPPREVKSVGWNLSLVLRSLTHPPYVPLKLSLVKHLTWKICFWLALALASRASESHGLSYCVLHTRRQNYCTFSFVSDFVPKAQNPSIHNPRF